MNYNKDLIELINNIKPITNTFGIIKEEDTESIKIKFKGETIGFILTAPEEYLQFPGDFLGFLDFDRFMKYYNIFDLPNKDEKLADTPLLEWVVNDEGAAAEIVISSSKGKQQFKYRTGTKQAIKEQKFNGAKLPSVETTFTLSKAQNEHLHKIISIIKPDIVNFTFVDDICKVNLKNMTFDDSYEIEYKLDTAVEEEFSMPILVESINLIPAGEYKLEVCSRGYIGFHQVRTDNIKLDLYVSKKVVR